MKQTFKLVDNNPKLTILYNMTYRTVENVFNPPAYHWVGDGFKVNNFIPSVIPMQRISPFVMLDYGASTYFPPTDEPKGVGSHPHRGFETVTIAYKGRVAHHDSRGNSGIIGEGEVQWMTAGSGILHKEYHEKEFSKQGGEFQMVQLWVNLPAKDKMTEPKYQALDKEKIVKIELEDQAGIVELIAGDLLGKTGPAFTFSPIILASLKLENDKELELNIPKEFNCALLVLEGGVEVCDTKVEENKMILLNNDGELIKVKTSQKSIALLMAGEAIKESIVSYGPFLMNTKQQIIEAIEDFNAGKFGELD